MATCSSLLHSLEISASRPLERLVFDSIDTDSYRPQTDILSLDGVYIGEPITSRH
jgi:hypothetical protein